MKKGAQQYDLGGSYVLWGVFLIVILLFVFLGAGVFTTAWRPKYEDHFFIDTGVDALPTSGLEEPSTADELDGVDKNHKNIFYGSALLLVPVISMLVFAKISFAAKPWPVMATRGRSPRRRIKLWRYHQQVQS